MSEKSLKQKAITEEIKKWKWLAEQSKEQKKKVHSSDYFKQCFFCPDDEMPRNYSFLCSFDELFQGKCTRCPVRKWAYLSGTKGFGSGCILDINSPYVQWLIEHDLERSCLIALDMVKFLEKAYRLNEDTWVDPKI